MLISGLLLSIIIEKPLLVVSSHPNPALPTAAYWPYPGYTLVALDNVVHLYNLEKKAVHTWTAPCTAIKTTPYLLPDGSLLIPVDNPDCTFPHGGGHPSGRFLRINWEGKVIWDFRFFGENFTPGYDIQPLANGNVLILASYENSDVPGRIFEIKPDGPTGGQVVWQCDVSGQLPGVCGYMNSISYNPAMDQLAITIQEPARRVVVIDHKSGKILSQFNRGFKDTIHACCWSMDTHPGTSLKIPYAQTQKMRVGNILVVSNGTGEVVEFNPKTGVWVKTFKYEFDEHQGGVQRLPNGNTLVTRGYSPEIEELDPNGKVIWTLKAPGEVLRSFRYSTSYPGVSKLVKNNK